jgi:predicted amidohydrolase
MWQIGYAPAPRDNAARAEWVALATPADGPFVAHFRALARELGMAIVITYLERGVDGPRNAATLIDRRGAVRLTYAKVHTCAFGWERALAPGEAFAVAELETAAGPVRVGLMICFDREFPEAARLLMLAGAEVVLTPNACALDEERLGQFRARSFENMVGVAMTNYAAPIPAPADAPGHWNGHSIAFSGVCYDRYGRPRDHKLVEAGEEEAVVVATFDLDDLRCYRTREPWGGAYRRPGAYGALLSDASDPVFGRRGPSPSPAEPAPR